MTRSVRGKHISVNLHSAMYRNAERLLGKSGGFTFGPGRRSALQGYWLARNDDMNLTSFSPHGG